jgi:hypothetical protein
VKRAAAKRPAGRAQDSGGDAPSHRPAACGLWQRRRPQPLCRAHSGRRETLYFAAALAIVVASLVIFQWNNQRVKEFERPILPKCRRAPRAKCSKASKKNAKSARTKLKRPPRRRTRGRSAQEHKKITPSSRRSPPEQKVSPGAYRSSASEVSICGSRPHNQFSLAARDGKHCQEIALSL